MSQAVDFQLTQSGVLVLLRPCTAAARAWMDENFYCDANGEPLDWVGDSAIVDPWFADDVLEAIVRDGLTLQR
jgi:hypothetical protein